MTWFAIGIIVGIIFGGGVIAVAMWKPFDQGFNEGWDAAKNTFKNFDKGYDYGFEDAFVTIKIIAESHIKNKISKENQDETNT